MEELRARAWADIDLGALEHNYRALRAPLPRGCRFLGVVKADAYGHGAVPVARKLKELGAEYLAVACVSEAAELRAAGVGGPILILGATPPEQAARLLELDLTQNVPDLETGRALSAAARAAGKKLKVHVKVDTGMGRLGFLAGGGDLGGAVEEIAALCALPGLEAEGIFTHFADADGSEEYTMGQFTRFLDVLRGLEERGVTFQIRHCAASAAVLNYPCTYLDMVRPGIALYGHYPAPGCEGLDGPGLRPVMAFRARVAAVRSLPAGSCISYGRTHTLTRDSRLAVLGVGYADGLPRLLSNRGEVLLRGRRCPIVGRVCMDLCMVDVTDVPEAAVGDTATLWGPELPIEEKADAVGTIQYELLCGVSRRVSRIYREE
ncbi:MAG TPA: alanine racemase [Candidatus Galloscillospira excrementavium]|nr:alanine racemase [Candidatus Galloscillospira excrementavium]